MVLQLGILCTNLKCHFAKQQNGVLMLRDYTVPQQAWDVVLNIGIIRWTLLGPTLILEDFIW